jgi:hypothetical protein
MHRPLSRPLVLLTFTVAFFLAVLDLLLSIAPSEERTINKNRRCYGRSYDDPRLHSPLPQLLMMISNRPWALWRR